MEKKTCDWGPVTHWQAQHVVKYECPYCHTFKVIQLCNRCWSFVQECESIFCLNCPAPTKVPLSLLYTHMGAP